MLEIKKVTKIYETEGFSQKALDSVSVNFRECEFASILGPSGSGKTTFLNIVGGLDHYTSGDLIINEVSTKKFKDSDWDSYRNHRIGFVFQNYNLISHQTILANVKLALTLSGISKTEATERAKKALIDVGLKDHINKRPNQLSGGQMQRVAIARALVNDPDILLADEPTGALDSETSIQIMELLKNIAKKKLVIMVTHNPDLAKEYSTRIITLKDGKITSDTNPYDGKIKTNLDKKTIDNKSKKTSMSFFTALALSFNNLMTKKGRTILVAFAGSIGIIGIALILAVSTGFQNYVDSIQEDTLTSYPLTLMYESTDITGVLLSMTSGNGENDNSNTVTERQYITSMLSNIKANDLKSFKKYLEDNYSKVKDDLSSIKYSYSIDPLIYTIDAASKLAKLNPSSLYTSVYGSSMLSSYSNMASIYSQMIDDIDTLNTQYDILSGRWPTKYNEMVIVLSEPNGISDLLVYSLGLRDTEELTKMVNSIMSGESTGVNNEPKTFTYEDLMNVKLKLIMPSDTYKYNTKYDVYEDMSADNDYMMKLYNSAEDIHIVGIVTSKPGSTTMALNPGVVYTKDLIDHIISYSYESEAVKKQLANPDIDIFSGKRFDSKENKFNFEFSDLVSIDSEKLSSAFNISIDENKMQNNISNKMVDIANSITTDTTPARTMFDNTLKDMLYGTFDEFIKNPEENTDSIVNNYLDTNIDKLNNLEKDYVIPASTFKTVYNGLLTGFVEAIKSAYTSMSSSIPEGGEIPETMINMIKEGAISAYLSNTNILAVSDEMSKGMTEAKMKSDIISKVTEIVSDITSSFSSSFSVDEDKIASAFKLNFSEDELARVVNAMMSNKETTEKNNLISLGYQDKEEPTFISFYFNSFDGKEHFLSFIDKYNKRMEKLGNEDKVINYSDTTGILMNSVKTIVNAVSYVLIAFVSISLVVSSIMIGIITYISVYERTKEIGILRSIGASKRNISSIFNAETFIIGLLSGMFGIGISYILIPIINAVLHHYTGNIPLRAMLAINNALVLVVLSIILTLIGGLIPARAASKRDPVEALRSE